MSAAVTAPTPPGNVRRPRFRVLANGTQLLGAIGATIQSNNHYQPDRFTVEIALYAGATGLAWWGEQNPPLLIDVQIAFLDPSQAEGTGSYQSVVQGEVDQIHIHPAGGLVTIEGRDLSARFVEARTQETFKNQTSSQIATTLAARHGLTAQVTATSTLVDRYYTQDHDKLTLGQFSRTTTEWDLLTFLAQREGFDCYVQGTTLYFQPIADPNADPYVIRWADPNPVGQSNVIDLRLGRALTLSKTIEVWVQSWRSKDARGFIKKARAVGAKSASAQASSNQVGSQTQRYVYTIPNLTEDEAQKRANALLADLTRHERTIEFSRAGDLTITPRSVVLLQGTNSSWDQSYFVDRVEREISLAAGFRMQVSAKNISQATELAAVTTE